MASRGRPISRYDCIERVKRAICDVFSYSGERPDFQHNPITYSPRLELGDLEVLEKALFECLQDCRRSVFADKDIPQVIKRSKKSDACKCCGDDGRDGAGYFKDGQCQKCRMAGCSDKECRRPPERTPFYNPGVDAPHGWGQY